MRALLLAFALGTGLLQLQAELPWLDGVLAWFAPCVLAAASLGWLVRAGGAARRASALALALPVAFGAGFYLAAWCATERMADELPAAWEGRDVRVVGVVDELPQAGSER